MPTLPAWVLAEDPHPHDQLTEAEVIADGLHTKAAVAAAVRRPAKSTSLLRWLLGKIWAVTDLPGSQIGPVAAYLVHEPKLDSDCLAKLRSLLSWQACDYPETAAAIAAHPQARTSTVQELIWSANAAIAARAGQLSGELLAPALWWVRHETVRSGQPLFGTPAPEQVQQVSELTLDWSRRIGDDPRLRAFVLDSWPLFLDTDTDTMFAAAHALLAQPALAGPVLA